MKRPTINPNLSWVVTTFLVAWGIVLIILVSPGFIGSSGLLSSLLILALPIVLLLAVASAVVFILGLSARSPKSEYYAHSPIAKVLGAMIVAAILTSTFTAIKSLWYSPLSDDYIDRFIYENIAMGVGYAGIVLTVILSALQKDIYWVTRKSRLKLDERQVQERRAVFETSYKLGAFIVLITVWLLSSTLHNMPTVIANHHHTIPGHLYWIGANLVLALFALPMLVAAWKKKSPKQV